MLSQKKNGGKPRGGKKSINNPKKKKKKKKNQKKKKKKKKVQNRKDVHLIIVKSSRGILLYQVIYHNQFISNEVVFLVLQFGSQLQTIHDSFLAKVSEQDLMIFNGILLFISHFILLLFYFLFDVLYFKIYKSNKLCKFIHILRENFLFLVGDFF